MQDIWHFFLGLSDGFRDTLGDVNPLPILVVALVIGFLQPKPANYALKALVALVLVEAFVILYPTLSRHAPVYPDLRRISTLVQMFLLYVFAYGMIGVLGSLKTAMKLGSTKSAH